MAQTGNWLQMMWNGKPYYDHPPMGFWLMAISYKILGINEFTTRLPSALLGLFSILLTYKVAFELSKKKTVGFIAALILGTSVWYVIRVRSGNLESVFMFFYILTVYLSVKSAKNFAWFPLTMLSFAGLILSKTLVGFSAVLLIFYFNFGQIIKIKKNFILLLLGIWLFFLALYPWYGYHLKNYPDFFQYHFIHKGTRDKTLISYFQLNIKQPLFYIHMGVRKWYYIWLASLGFLIFTFKFLKKNIFFLILWNFIVVFPFLTSKETELWHLIPVYLPLSLIVAVGVYEFDFTFLNIIKKIFIWFERSRELKHKNILLDIARRINNKRNINIVYLTAFLYLAFIQFKIFYKEVFPESKYVTDQVDVAKRIAKYKEKIYLDIDYLPVAIFYSGKRIDTLVYEASGEATFTKLFEIDNGNIIGVTKNWVIEDLSRKNFPLTVLEKNNTYSIITKPKEL